MQEESKGLGNNYNMDMSRRFFRRWWKVLVAAFVVGAIASGIAAWLIKPLYKSSAVIFPTNSNRLSKAIMDYHYSLDFMDYSRFFHIYFSLIYIIFYFFRIKIESITHRLAVFNI